MRPATSAHPTRRFSHPRAVALATLAALIACAGTAQATPGVVISHSGPVTGPRTGRRPVQGPPQAPGPEATATGSEGELTEARVSPTALAPSAATSALAPTVTGPFGASWGYNAKGELGASYKDNYEATPVPVVGVSAIKELVVTSEYELALTSEGSVMGWGGNSSGQLADGTTETKVNPVKAKLPGPAVQIAANGEHGIALLADGSVYTWGNNLFGQLGNGTDGGGVETCKGTLCHSTLPMLVKGLRNVKAVYAGGADDAALLNDGTVVAWGENKSGQLGDGTTIEKDTPTVVRGLSEVRSLALGGQATIGSHILAILSSGRVVGLGNDQLGQIGDGTSGVHNNKLTPVTVKATGVVELSTSWTHTLARLSTGAVLAWGSNKDGEIGSSTTATCGSLPCQPVPKPVPGISGVVSLAAGFNLSVAASAGKAYAWGVGEYGRLGNGTTANRTSPGLVSRLSGVQSVYAGETHAASLLQSPLPPTASLSPGLRSLTVSWTAPPSEALWRVGYRLLGGTVLRVKLPAATRTYTITGLGPSQYEVVLEQMSGTYFARTFAGTPLL